MQKGYFDGRFFRIFAVIKACKDGFEVRLSDLMKFSGNLEVKQDLSIKTFFEAASSHYVIYDEK